MAPICGGNVLGDLKNLQTYLHGSTQAFMDREFVERSAEEKATAQKALAAPVVPEQPKEKPSDDLGGMKQMDLFDL